MLKGDDKAKATVDAMMGGFLSGVSKYSLEKGVASSVLQNKKSLIQQVRRKQSAPSLGGTSASSEVNYVGGSRTTRTLSKRSPVYALSRWRWKLCNDHSSCSCCG